MKYKLFFLIVFLFYSIRIFAVEELKIKFVRYKLKNGLTVLLHKDTAKPIVSVGMMYHVGSKDEEPNRTGFAHFFEHLMFEGTKNIKRGEFDKLVLNAGGESNAYTTFDYTYYEMSLPSNQLPLALWMESQRLQYLKIDKKGVETQRKVVKEERRERLDNQPYGNLDEIIYSNAFPNHPYSWLPIGSNQYIDKATLEEFEEFHKKYYIPEKAILTIAGDFKIKNTKKLIDTYFQNIPSTKLPIPPKRNNLASRNKNIEKTVYYNVEFPALSYAFLGPPQAVEDYYIFLFIDIILAGGESARLNRKLKTDENLILNLETGYRALEEKGLYTITCFVKNKANYKAVNKNLTDEINRLRTELISDRELEKARNQIQRMTLDSVGDLSGIAESLAEYELFFGNASYFNSEHNKIMRITKEDVMRVANKYLTLENKVILNYLPSKKK